MSGRHERPIRIIPDPRVDVNDWDVDGYPASIFVKMGDNTTMEFVRKIEQPGFVKAIEGIRRMVGYERKESK